MGKHLQKYLILISRRNQTATALGMTNTQNIILNHKGKIEVFSEEGKGTSFVISLNILRKETTLLSSGYKCSLI